MLPGVVGHPRVPQARGTPTRRVDINPRIRRAVVWVLLVFNLALLVLVVPVGGGDLTNGPTGVVLAAGLGMVLPLPGWVLVDLVLLLVWARACETSHGSDVQQQGGRVFRERNQSELPRSRD